MAYILISAETFTVRFYKVELGTLKKVTHSGLRLAATRSCGSVAIRLTKKLSELGNDMDNAWCSEVTSVNITYLASACTQHPKPEIIVAVIRPIVVAIGRAQVLRIVVPTATTNNMVRALFGHYAKQHKLSISFLRKFKEFA